MSKIYIAKDAHYHIKEYLTGLGHTLEPISSNGIVDRGISNHPDIFLCKMGIGDKAPVYMAAPEDLGKYYPQDAAFNAACTGKYFIHNLSCTAPRLLKVAEEMGMYLIDVKQGYTKCSVAIVDENSIITYDAGIAKACEGIDELSVLLVQPGFVRLDGYDTGFIGGSCGRVGDELVFNGDLSSHPDFAKILEFTEERGINCKWFPEYQLTDIGSIL